MARAAAYENARSASAATLRHGRHGQVGIAAPEGFCRIACPCGAAVWRPSSDRVASVAAWRQNRVAVFHWALVPRFSGEIFSSRAVRGRDDAAVPTSASASPRGSPRIWEHAKLFYPAWPRLLCSYPGTYHARATAATAAKAAARRGAPTNMGISPAGVSLYPDRKAVRIHC